MAEEIPFNVAASFITRLGSLAFREFGRINGVTDELERLKNTVESIKAVLLDADQRQEQDHAVKLWIARLKEVLHAADDLFDDIATEDLRLKVDGRNKIVKEVCHFFSSSNPIVFRRQMAQKVEKIRQNFNDVVEDMSKLNLIPRPVVDNQSESAWRETGSSISGSSMVESDVIGREDSKREILNLLRQPHENQNVSLIAIVGIGGLGKTAITRSVYSDAEVKHFFERRIWVCVSDNFKVKTVVRKIVESFIGRESNGQEPVLLEKLSSDYLRKKLHELLNGKRYLLVMDDMWDESYEKWAKLRKYFMCGAQGSKILVTTRSELVAKAMGESTLYPLKGLNTKESWSLLKILVFENPTYQMSYTLESIGKKIAEKCKGVPLAIKTLAGILKNQYEESHWINVLEVDFWGLDENKNGIMSVLKLSYQNLSPQLGQCFAYCSLYPKNHEIEKDELIQLWMAQGYLECEWQHMEDVGNQFVQTLLMKSFFQDAKFDEHDNIYSFKMHDIMHDLALLVAGNDYYLDRKGRELVNRPMHISLKSNDVGLLDSLDARRLRTLFLQRSNNMETGVQLRGELSVISSFQCLRVLKMSASYSLKKLPDSIDQLKHLRYLDLSWCQELVSLPKSMSNLVNLQTLKLTGCKRLQFSTKVVTKLIKLRHLDISDCKAFEDMMPAGLGKLSSLQYLSTFVVGDEQKRKKMKIGKLNELKDLDNLRGNLYIKRLGLVRDVWVESRQVNLKHKKILESLNLEWSGGNNQQNDSDSLQLLENLHPHQYLKRLVVSGYPGLRFSNWLSSLTNVSHITLSGFDNCRYLPPLECLPLLKSLDISLMESLEYICFEVTTVKFFQYLERLQLTACKNLRGWWQRMGDNVSYTHHPLLPQFHRLLDLLIKDCPKFTCMPTFPSLNNKLVLHSSTLKPLTDTLIIASASSFTPLSMLRSLEIGGQLLDMKYLPKRWMVNLTSLQHLAIEGVDEFENWLDHLDCLPSLKKIQVRHSGIQALPDWTCNILSLEHIRIEKCFSLMSLPEGMPRLTNLRTLKIDQCPHLLDRYQRESGADWHKISHIRNRIFSR